MASVVRHLPKYYQYTSIGTYNALLSFLNITAEEIKGERNGEPIHGLVYFALNDKGEKVSNPFKASLFGKHAGVNGLQRHFGQSKEKMKTNPARSVLKNAVELAIHTTDSERNLKSNLPNRIFRRLSAGTTADGFTALRLLTMVAVLFGMARSWTETCLQICLTIGGTTETNPN
ncbi:hypothetical protein [Sphingobacterium wenxiniae]|uniref:Uncharacterized protein n=1 Tax=Sphingobacterium wenxiniae TaxID=683125 RepID=A0A1I6V3P6_9SPHI|nr:hypothetical protein SAMN05660206_11149 [Sphingobacterium wenxiniae]